MKKRGRPAKQKNTPKISNNPFEIKDDILYSGRGVDDHLVTALLESVMQLEPGDIRHSVNIPTSVAPTKKDANNLVLNLRRVMASYPDKKYRSVVLAVKAVYQSGDGKVYAGTRLFRKV